MQICISIIARLACKLGQESMEQTSSSHSMRTPPLPSTQQRNPLTPLHIRRVEELAIFLQYKASKFSMSVDRDHQAAQPCVW